MYKRVLLSMLLMSCLVLWPHASRAQNTQNFVINSFFANYVLSKDSAGLSHMQVDEYIVAQFPDYDQNHGILRAIPETYGDNQLHPKIIGVDHSFSDASPNSSPWAYTTSSQNGNLVLKIGDAGTYVHGQQAFHIKYSLSNRHKKVQRP